MGAVLQQICDAVLAQDASGRTDARLLECFRDHHDEIAFEALVRRHGPMVLGVCLRVLRNPQDAEDAFQTTFLVLVRKAASIVPPGMVANWLYGVAYQTAIKARAMANRRGAKERQVMGTPEPAAPEDAETHWHELRPIIDDELARMPAKYRAPLVLCDIEERSYKEVAEQLGWPEGTVAGRLSRARAMLANRLSRRGVVLPIGVLAALLTQNAASACVPDATVASTVKAASLFVAGRATTGAISANVIVLTEGVLKTMMLSKLKTATAVLFAACLVVSGVGVAISTPVADAQDQKKAAPVLPQPKKEDPKKVDPKAAPKVDPKGDPKNGGNNEKNGNNNQNGNDEKNGNNNQNGNDEKNGNNNQNGNDEKNGQNNQNGNDEQGVVKVVDPKANTITVVVNQKGKPVEKVFALPKDVPVVLGGKPAKLGDLKPGMKVGVVIGKDKKGVVGIKQVNEPNGPNNNGNGQKNQKNG